MNVIYSGMKRLFFVALTRKFRAPKRAGNFQTLGAVVTQLIFANVAFAQTWNTGAGNWVTASNWTPATVPNSSSATVTFNALANQSASVSLSGGPFTVSTLSLDNDVNGGFTFQGGTLQLDGSATINVQSHNLAPDFAATSTISLLAQSATINTVFADSTLTIAGGMNDNAAPTPGLLNFSKIGPGTLILTGASAYDGSTTVKGGTLTIQSGGTLSNSGGTIGLTSGSAATVTVTGPGSTWTNSSNLLVGINGTGTLNIQNGGMVFDAGDDFLGTFLGSTGTVTVSGSGSAWISSGNLIVGGEGTGTLAIQSGGLIFHSGDTFLGDEFLGIPSNSAGTVTVSGTGSTWTNTGAIFVGGNNLGPNGVGTLEIINGGTVNSGATTIWNTGTLVIGGTVTLNSALTIDGGTIRTAASASFVNNVTLGLGGVILDSNGFNSTFSGAFTGAGGITKINSGTVTLTGASVYSGNTTVSGGTLSIANGGKVTDGLGSIAGPSSAVVVTGAGSTWTNSGPLSIGNIGASSLTVQNGAAVSDSQGFIGPSSGSIGVVTVAGPGSTWTNSGPLFIGGNNFGPGGAGLLEIANGGTVSAAATTIWNTGTLAVQGSIALNSPLTIEGGTIRTDANAALSNNVTLGASGAILDSNSFVSTFSGAFTGSGGITKIGAGTISLVGANTYSGGANLNGGTLAVNSDSNLGTGPLNFNGGALEALTAGGGITSTKAVTLNVDGGTFLADTGTSSTLSGLINGIGSFTKIGAGTLRLTGANSYSGGTNLNGGILAITNDTNLGTGPLSFNGGTLEALTAGGGIASTKAVTLNSSGGTFLADTGTNSILSGLISGIGSLTKSGVGSLTLTGANTYSGGTNLNGGIFAVNNDANLGTGPLSFNGGTLEALAAGGGITSTKTITLNAGGGTFLADPGTNSTLSGVISGVGSLTKSGVGSLILTGANTYSGGTNLNGGLLAVNRDANLGTGPLSFNGATLETLSAGGGITSTKAVALNSGGATFLADPGTTSTLSGQISGVGSLAKTGVGALVLTGANTYSGGTVLDNGILMVGSPRALGTGNVSLNGGVLTTDPQAINVGGNYTQTGGTLLLHVAGANVGQYDSLNVGGHASLGGTLQLVALNGFRLKRGDQLTLVTAADGVQGRFSTFLDPFTSNTVLQPELIYQPNDVILELLFTSTAPFSPFALTPNQRAVARNLDKAIFDNRATALIDFLASEPVAVLPRDFDAIAPADLSSLYEVSFSGVNVQRFNLVTRMADIREGATGLSSELSVRGNPPPMGKDGKSVVQEKSVMQPSPENRWGVFVIGDGDFVNVNEDGNASGYDFTTAGVTLGVDYRVTKNLAIGLMGDYAHTWTDLVRNSRITINSGRGGLYGTWWDRGFYVDGFVGGGYNSYDTSRGGLRGPASGSTDGGEFETFAGAGYDAKAGNWSFGPFATLAYTYVSLNNFTEHGSLAPLDIVSQHQDSLRTDLGLQAEYRIKTAGGPELQPHVRLAWEHEYLYNALPIDARLSNGAGGVFTVVGPSEGHDSMVINAGINVKLTQNLLLYLDYDGQISRDHYSSQAVAGGLRWSF